jgi:uncharacterized protein YaaQ
MKLAMIMMRGSSCDRVVSALRERGLPVEVIHNGSMQSGERRGTALAAVRDESIPALYEVIAAFGGSVVSWSNPLVPLVDPGEYHVASPVPSQEGGVTVYLLRLRRYERIR